MAAPADVVSEVKCCIALHCYSLNSLYLNMTQPQQELFLFKLYHGTEGQIPAVKKFVSGSEAFSSMFERVSNGSNFQLRLLEVLHRHENMNISVGQDCSLTVKLLKGKSMRTPKDIEGKTLRGYVREALLNTKKCVVIMEKFLVNGQMPSGKSYPDDYAEHLLNEMFREIGKSSGPRDPTWTFRGFQAYMAWGAIPLGYKFELRIKEFSLKLQRDADDNKGRSNLRKKELESKTAKKNKSAEPVTMEKFLEVKHLQMYSAKHENIRRSIQQKEQVLADMKETAWRFYQSALDIWKETKLPEHWAEVQDKKAKFEKSLAEWENGCNRVIAQNEEGEEYKVIDKYLNAALSNHIIDLTGSQANEEDGDNREGGVEEEGNEDNNEDAEEDQDVGMNEDGVNEEGNKEVEEEDTDDDEAGNGAHCVTRTVASTASSATWTDSQVLRARQVQEAARAALATSFATPTIQRNVSASTPSTGSSATWTDSQVLHARQVQEAARAALATSFATPITQGNVSASTPSIIQQNRGLLALANEGTDTMSHITLPTEFRRDKWGESHMEHINRAKEKYLPLNVLAEIGNSTVPEESQLSNPSQHI